MQLSPEQKFIFDKYKEGKNIFITGPGGSGKTLLIQTIETHGKNEGKNIQVCAMTGCAAILLQCGAKTLHSWAGIGLAKGSIKETIDRVIKSRHRRKNWNKVQILIIDEISMLSLKLLIILDTIARTIKKNNKPFGGIQIIFAGDFYQLPPIPDNNDPLSSQFCFEYEEWNNLFDYQVQLKKIFRQQDPVYSKILNEIRIGKIKKKSYELLQKYIRLPNPDDQIKPPIILACRKDVEDINKNELDKIVDEGIIYKYKEINDLTSINEKAKQFITENDINNELTLIKNNIMAEPEIKLKIGTQVMCIANLDFEGINPLVNGSQGIITDFIDGFPQVQFKSGEKRIISYHTWPSEKFPEIGIMQIPLIHSWAITIHKSQGTTLDMAQIDIGNKIFECGQTYVALSRIKSLDGLYLIAFNPYKIKIYKKVADFYNKIQ